MKQRIKPEDIIDTQEKMDKLMNDIKQRNSILFKDIDSIKRNKSLKTASIIAFLIEIQYIEAQLVYLIQQLDMCEGLSLLKDYVMIDNKDYLKYLNPKIGFDEFTLGDSLVFLCRYKRPKGVDKNKFFLTNLKRNLNELKQIRNYLVHRVFVGLSSFNNLIEKSKQGLELNQIIIEDINYVFNFLKDKKA